MSVLKYKNPSYVEGGSQPKWLPVGRLPGSSGGNGDTGGGGSDTKQYETVNVSISADNGASITADVTVNGETKSVTSGSSVPWEVEYGTEYTIEVADVEGYSKPETLAFTAEQSTRNVELVYNRIAVSIITINQNITDPATMVSGDVKGETIELIRANSHRYLGKYTDENTMTICQLDDNDSNYYFNGSDAYLDGSEGDVFMKLPKFWWKCWEEPEASDVWKIGFAYGAAPDDTWNEWSGNELIGSVLSSNSSKCVSIAKSAAYSSTSNIHNFTIPRTKERGFGYEVMKLKHFNIVRLLFLAYYGNTDAQNVLGNGDSPGSSYINSLALGMKDTIPNNEDRQAVCFWGISDVFGYGGHYEVISNVVANSSTALIVTEDDGTERELNVPSGYIYVYKLLFGEYGDCLPNGSEGNDISLGYTDYCDFNSLDEAQYLYSWMNSETGKTGLFSLRGLKYSTSGNSVYARLTFKGTLIEEKDVEAFRLIEITN